MSIEDRLDREPAAGWKPNPGDQIVGTIVEISEAPGTNWGPYPLLVVAKTDGTEVAVHAFHGVLRNELSAKRPSVGDKIGIRYLGKQQPKNDGGQAYEGYRVVLERVTPAPAPDWDSHGAQARSELAGTGAPVPAAASSSVDDWANEEPF